MTTAKPDGTPSNTTTADHGPKPLGRGAVRAALAAILPVLAVYIWLVSIGTWTKLPASSDYYDELATAFRHGQLSLELRPDPALLALPDPYNPEMRKGVPFLSDASLYRGRYYLYFGPVPALLLVIVKTVLPGVVGDQYLVFVFVAATFIVLALFIVRIWRRFFPEIPPWIVGTSILTVGLIGPFGWILGSRASVHDAAIASGQFFFLAGLLAAFDALDGASIRKSRGLLAGALWALALGSRITEVVPISIMLVLIAAGILRKYQRPGMFSQSMIGMLAFSLPLGLAVVTLGWYNWARFGSVIETGITYQLALLHLQKYMPDMFSVKYVPQNLYNYLLNLPKLRYNFPYIWPRQGILKSIVPTLTLPPLYYAEEMTGLLFTAPFLVFAVAATIPLRPRNTGQSRNKADVDFLNWLSAALGSSFLSGFAVFLLFFWASERYLLDFIPCALLLGVTGLWKLDESLMAHHRRLAVFMLLTFGLIAASILSNNLLAITLNANGFRLLDPGFWRMLNNLFRP